MTGNVTVGLDGSPESLEAVRWAAHEADVRDVPLHIVHVREWPLTPATPLPPIGPPQAEALLRQAAEEAGRVRDLRVITDDPVGAPGQVLLSEAGEPGKVEVLVLGSRGLSGMTGFLLGSVGLAVAAESERPVVLVRPEKRQGPDARTTGRTAGPGELVLGLGLREAASPEDGLLAFGFAAAVRRRCALHVVHAWSLPAAYGYAESVDPAIGQELGGHIAKTLHEALAPWRERFPTVPVTARAVIGAPGAQLVYEAAGADLLIVGRRTRKAPVGPRLGHVAHAVIHHATTPVAVVPHT